MQTKQITVQYVNQPKSPKGHGSVKDTDGTYWKVWRDQLSSFQPNGTYTVGYETEMYQGKEQYTVKEVQNVTGSQLPAPASNGNGHTDSRDKNIFICGVVNQGIAAGKIDPLSAMDLTAARKAAIAAFEACP